MTTVTVESALGPIHGYYHKKDMVHDSLHGEDMSREEAEVLGYSPCVSCFGAAGEKP